MLKNSGQLIEEDKQLVIAWLEEKTQGYATQCSVCGTQSWIIGDHLVAPSNFSVGGITIGGDVYPQVMLICKNCAHTIFLNAPLMGLMKKMEKRAATEKKEAEKQEAEKQDKELPAGKVAENG